MNDFDGDAPIVNRDLRMLETDSKIAINITPRVKGMSRVLSTHHKLFDDLVYVQQVYEELLLTLWWKPIKGFPQGLPASKDHFLYQEGKLRFFTDAVPWKRFLARRSFVFGNRLHGNVAALTAGTPAMLLAHDSRTLELAEFHRIPFKLMPKNPDEVDARDLYAEADLDGWNAHRTSNRRIWERFLERNSLSHIHELGKANPEYKQTIDKGEHPEGVRPLGYSSREDLISRIHWLWQGTGEDRHRVEGAYRPPFEPDSQRHDSAFERTKENAKALKKLEREVGELRAQVSKTGRLSRKVSGMASKLWLLLRAREK